jgi:hypothetical protein
MRALVIPGNQRSSAPALREHHCLMSRTELLERYRQGHLEVVGALEGVTPAELDLRPGPGCWTAREVVHHLADSETTSYIRLRKLLAQDGPVLEAYDEAEFARRLHYERPIEPSLAVLAAVRAASAQLLDSLGEAEWMRVGRHSESGPYSIDDWLAIYAAHAHDHADQIRRARRGIA